MCGIVGVASSNAMSLPMKEFFQQLLFHDVVRGHHATGVAAIDTMDRNLVVAKKAVASPIFLDDKEMMEPLFAPRHNFNIYIGHNRWATSGAKDKDENAPSLCTRGYRRCATMVVSVSKVFWMITKTSSLTVTTCTIT